MTEVEHSRLSDGAAVYRISGELDIAAAPAATMGLEILEMSHPSDLILDLRDVTMIDSLGLRVLVEAASRARNERRHLTIVADPNGILRKLLTFAALDLRVPVVSEMPDHTGGVLAKA